MSLRTLDFRHMGDLAYNAIRDAIITGQLEPGARLSQDELARQLGVSRAPVRDALNRLEAEGLVSSAPPKGVVVAEMTTEGLLEIFEVRAVIDSYTARRACELLSKEDLNRLQEIVETTASLAETDDIHTLVQLHADFHHLIYAACGNSELNRIARNLWDRSYRYRVLGFLNKVVAASALSDHQAILRALQDRDPLQAEQLMVTHNQHTVDRILQQSSGRLGAVKPRTTHPEVEVDIRTQAMASMTQLLKINHSGGSTLAGD